MKIKGLATLNIESMRKSEDFPIIPSKNKKQRIMKQVKYPNNIIYNITYVFNFIVGLSIVIIRKIN